MAKMILIAGPCAVEDKKMCFEIAKRVKEICNRLDIYYVFKASYKKANRTKLDSFAGIGDEKALKILKDVNQKFDVPIITDVHETFECEKVGSFCKYLQIPAFLCRQTDLILSAAKTGRSIVIKKGQFMSPESMGYAVEKVRSVSNCVTYLIERGTTFGYNGLVVDMTSIPKMKKFAAKVILDCTHSVQKPNQIEGVTGGDPEMIETIALAGIAAGADGLFFEVHPDPATAKSDPYTMLRLDKLESILEKCVKIKGIL